MKFAISALILACSAFTSGLNLLPNLDSLGFSTPADLLPQQVAPIPKSRHTVDTHALIRGAAEKHGVPAAFVQSIVAAESNFDCDAVSPKGAIGLMQLMPETAKEYGADPTVPEQNIDAGTHYLRVLMDRYQKHRNSLVRVIAAYNAGPAMVDRYHGIPPFRETRRYVVRVLRLLSHFQREPQQMALSSAFGFGGQGNPPRIAIK
jgi:soluble lytic murein transglycosylase-like protein